VSIERDRVALDATGEVDKKYRHGARSAAGRMTPLSLTPNVREHRFQMHHYRGCAGDPLSRGSSCFLLPTFLCSRQRKVGAAPHRGNANRPIRKQGKANTAGAQSTSAAQANKPSKTQHRRRTESTAKRQKPRPKAKNPTITPTRHRPSRSTATIFLYPAAPRPKDVHPNAPRTDALHC
jgi:hypothetical protein